MKLHFFVNDQLDWAKRANVNIDVIYSLIDLRRDFSYENSESVKSEFEFFITKHPSIEFDISFDLHSEDAKNWEGETLFTVNSKMLAVQLSVNNLPNEKVIFVYEANDRA